MSSAPGNFREADLRRILSAAKKADIAVRIEIAGNKIVIITGRPPSDESPASSWDEAIADLEAK
jgi:hypothetical protein